MGRPEQEGRPNFTLIKGGIPSNPSRPYAIIPRERTIALIKGSSDLDEIDRLVRIKTRICHSTLNPGEDFKKLVARLRKPPRKKPYS